MSAALAPAPAARPLSAAQTALVHAWRAFAAAAGIQGSWSDCGPYLHRLYGVRSAADVHDASAAATAAELDQAVARIRAAAQAAADRRRASRRAS